MEMWKKAENGESVKPPAVSIDASGVVLTRNYRFVPATEDKPEHWEYEEAQMSLEAYEVYRSLNADIDYLLMITEDL